MRGKAVMIGGSVVSIDDDLDEPPPQIEGCHEGKGAVLLYIKRAVNRILSREPILRKWEQVIVSYSKQ